MRTYVSATPIISGKVIIGTHVCESVPGDVATAELIGMVVLQAVNNARRYGYYMQDTNAFIRVELRQHETLTNDCNNT